MGNQCQMVDADSLVGNKVMMGPSTTFMGINFVGIFYVLALYTVGAFLIGYGCGHRIIKRKTFIEKKNDNGTSYLYCCQKNTTSSF